MLPELNWEDFLREAELERWLIEGHVVDFWKGEVMSWGASVSHEMCGIFICVRELGVSTQGKGSHFRIKISTENDERWHSSKRIVPETTAVQQTTRQLSCRGQSFCYIHTGGYGSGSQWGLFREWTVCAPAVSTRRAEETWCGGQMETLTYMLGDQISPCDLSMRLGFFSAWLSHCAWNSEFQAFLFQHGRWKLHGLLWPAFQNTLIFYHPSGKQTQSSPGFKRTNFLLLGRLSTWSQREYLRHLVVYFGIL